MHFIYLSRHGIVSQTIRCGCFHEKLPRVIQCFTTNSCLEDIETHKADFTINVSLSQELWIFFWIWYKLVVRILNTTVSVHLSVMQRKWCCPAWWSISGFLGDKSTAKWLYNSVIEWWALQDGYVVHKLVMNFKAEKVSSQTYATALT